MTVALELDEVVGEGGGGPVGRRLSWEAFFLMILRGSVGGKTSLDGEGGEREVESGGREMVVVVMVAREGLGRGRGRRDAMGGTKEVVGVRREWEGFLRGDLGGGIEGEMVAVAVGILEVLLGEEGKTTEEVGGRRWETEAILLGAGVVVVAFVAVAGRLFGAAGGGVEGW